MTVVSSSGTILYDNVDWFKMQFKKPIYIVISSIVSDEDMIFQMCLMIFCKYWLYIYLNILQQ